MSAASFDRACVGFFDWTYQYDGNGNITQIGQTGSTTVSNAATYTYDARNRLLKRIRGSDTKHFTYDAIGNLTGKSTASAGQTNQAYDATRRHQLTVAQGVSYAYDADGNATTRGSQRFVYDALQRLECRGTSGSPCSEPYLYGITGERIASEGGTAPQHIFAGDLFEYEPGTGAAIVRIPALGRQIAYKRVPGVTLRAAHFPAISAPLQPLIGMLLRVVLALSAACLLALLVRLGLLERLAAAPVSAALSLALVAQLAVPVGLLAATLPTNQGVYRRWIWSDPLGLGDHPKPASCDHLKTGQLERRPGR